MTTASSRASSSALVLALLALSACTDQEPGLRATTSLRVEILNAPLPEGVKVVDVRVTALDQDGALDPSVDATLDVYAQYLGTLSPDPARGRPLTTLEMVDGSATGQVTLAYAFGSTVLWIEDTDGADATFATGVSPPINFPEPFLADVSRPANERRSDSLERSPLEGKQVEIAASEHGAAGNLVVTGVYAQGYTVSDVRAEGRTAGDYAHAFIFTFGRPVAKDFRAIRVGHLVEDVSGGVSEFNGLTEFNFPSTHLTEDEPDLARVPEPVPLSADWLVFRAPNGADDPENPMINLEKLESALVVIEGKLCALDDQYTTYGQWKLDVGKGCGTVYNVVSRGQVADFDPATLTTGTRLRVVGTLRAVNIGTFHVWIVQPRQASDIQTVP